MINSLYFRLNIAAILVLLLFFAVVGAVLDNAFWESARSSLRERMLGQIYQLVTTSEITESGQLLMPLPTHLPEPLLALPDSGLYAFVTANGSGRLLWRSPSLQNQANPMPFPLQVGNKKWVEVAMANGKECYLLGFGFQRTLKTGIYPLNFYLMAELAPLNKQITLYRRWLWGGLASAAMLLLAVQIWLLHWGLSPLRKVGQELSAIESGAESQINGQYPREVSQLTNKVNTLLVQERARQTRYRNALADLAHSLKTPLAVLRSAVDQPDVLANTVEEQSSRMLHIVERQLQRAGAASAAATAAPVNIGVVVDRIMSSLNKVYRNKNVRVANQVDQTLSLRCVETDLMEILGNLLDNAFKWCHNRVEILAWIDAQSLIISINDDGAGINAKHIGHILQRGGRADESTHGHGIGLSVALDIVEAYQGELRIGSSLLGGAAVILEFYP